MIGKISKEEQNTLKEQVVKNARVKSVLFKEFSSLMDQIASEMKTVEKEVKTSVKKAEDSSISSNKLKSLEKSDKKESKKAEKAKTREVDSHIVEKEERTSAKESSSVESEEISEEESSEHKVSENEKEEIIVEESGKEVVAEDPQNSDVVDATAMQLKSEDKPGVEVKSSKSDTVVQKDFQGKDFKHNSEVAQTSEQTESADSLEGGKIDLKSVKAAVSTIIENAEKATTKNSFLGLAVESLSAPQGQNLLDKAQLTSTLIKKATEGISGIKELGGSQGTSSSANGAFANSNNKNIDNAVLKKEVRLPKQLTDRTMEKIENALKEVNKSKDGKTISIRLDPPSLGSVRVDVSIKDGNLHARLSADSSQVTTLLRDKSHEVQQMLRKLGLEVDQVTVSVGGENSSYSGESNAQSNFDFAKAHKELFSSGTEASIGVESNTATPKASVVADDHWVA